MNCMKFFNTKDEHLRHVCKGAGSPMKSPAKKSSSQSQGARSDASSSNAGPSRAVAKKKTGQSYKSNLSAQNNITKKLVKKAKEGTPSSGAVRSKFLYY